MADIPRWLELQQEIDFRYFLLDEIRKRLPKSSIEEMIDDATGHWEQQKKDVREICLEMKKLKKEWQEVTGNEINTDMEDQILTLLK